ncbi:single-stranded DNA-binding protein [Selenomonas sp. FC4001]|nr:single-stranded DNA-binding protein [Selenomonas sp. FC4001]
MNHVALTGKISQNIELHTTGNDNSVTTIHLVVQSDYYKAGEEPT